MLILLGYSIITIFLGALYAESLRLQCRLMLHKVRPATLLLLNVIKIATLGVIFALLLKTSEMHFILLLVLFMIGYWLNLIAQRFV